MDGPALLSLSSEEIRDELKLPIGRRKALERAIVALKQSQATANAGKGQASGTAISARNTFAANTAAGLSKEREEAEVTTDAEAPRAAEAERLVAEAAAKLEAKRLAVEAEVARVDRRRRQEEQRAEAEPKPEPGGEQLTAAQQKKRQANRKKRTAKKKKQAAARRGASQPQPQIQPEPEPEPPEPEQPEAETVAAVEPSFHEEFPIVHKELAADTKAAILALNTSVRAWELRQLQDMRELASARRAPFDSLQRNPGLSELLASVSDVRQLVLAHVGIAQFWRCRRVSKQWKRWAEQQLAALPPALALGGDTHHAKVRLIPALPHPCSTSSACQRAQSWWLSNVAYHFSRALLLTISYVYFCQKILTDKI